MVAINLMPRPLDALRDAEARAALLGSTAHKIWRNAYEHARGRAGVAAAVQEAGAHIASVLGAAAAAPRPRRRGRSR